MKTALIIIGLLVFVIVLLYIFAKSKIKNTPVVEDHENIIVLSDRNFDHQTKNRVVLVDFWAEWCVPCRMMAPVLNELAEELNGNAFVGKLNVEQYQALAQKFNIRNIPTMILFRNGQEVKRFIGMKTKDFLIREIQKVA
ncbi:MAG TPA: thioredoxin [Bacteroidales bacterium]|jgi:thioredoxin 1|nr:thioredoxin [Bacteroidales bacterium]HOS70953.1 thioredoxin [Bacteroidales bacterium]HQH23263.1 thioredoxin [Bacteroidales bacterium]HQJ80879.1 thioredoxin [Bacteroidales bacterium]